jgi:glycosyltransferase involved in cell wall biosynthesis
MTGTNGATRKLCFFTNSYTFGGVEEHIVLLCGLVPQLGYTPSVVCSKHDALQPLYDRLNALGVPIHWYEPEAGAIGKWRSIRALAKLLRAQQIDVMHLHLIFTDGGRMPLLAARLAGIPVVVTHHAAPQARQELMTNLARRPMLALARKFIAVSHANRRDHIRYMGLPADRLVAIHNGIVVPREPPDRKRAHDELTASLGLPPDTKLVGGVGRLNDQKGFHWLLDAAKKFLPKVPSARVVLVGDGPLRGELEAQAQSLGIADRVLFLGFRKDAPKVLAALDVLAMPSVFEGLPLVLLEACAAGCPAVAHAVDGIPEVIEDEVSGFLVPRGNVELLANRIAQVLRDEQLASNMSQAAWRRALNGFTAERMAADTVAIYDELRA